MGFMNDSQQPEEFNMLRQDDKLDLQEIDPRVISSKVYNVMSDYYLKLKTKLGLVDVEEEIDDILEYPIPIEDQFPENVI
jgi:hypothetical protein